MQKISIHALREEGDGRCDVVDLQVLEISIHALREEGDLVIQPFGQTLEDFYPRPPRGGRPGRKSADNKIHKNFKAPPTQGVRRLA